MSEKIISVEQMRKSDAYTIENFVPGKELMYRAAMGVFEAYEEWAGKRTAIVVGGGNNGGDGYCLAGILKKNGIDCDVIKVSEKMSEDGRYYCDIASGLGVQITEFKGVSEVQESAEFKGISEVRGSAEFKETSEVQENSELTEIADVTDFTKYDIIVDCILGTGFKGAVRGKAKDAIEAINASRKTTANKAINASQEINASKEINASQEINASKAINSNAPYVISVDINSGMDGDTGEAVTAVKSDLTVSIGFIKQGLVTEAAKEYIGKLVNVDIGIVLV